MKQTIIAVALLAAIGSASAAPNKVIKAERGDTVTIFDNSISPARTNSDGVVLVTFVADYDYPDGHNIRNEELVSCDQNGGRIGSLNNARKVVSEGIWVIGGGRIKDIMGEHACRRGIQKASGTHM